MEEEKQSDLSHPLTSLFRTVIALHKTGVCARGLELGYCIISPTKRATILTGSTWTHTGLPLHPGEGRERKHKKEKKKAKHWRDCQEGGVRMVTPPPLCGDVGRRSFPNWHEIVRDRLASVQTLWQLTGPRTLWSGAGSRTDGEAPLQKCDCEDEEELSHKI